MALIEWSSELSVGIDSIDNQHQKLINMINALNDAMSTGEANEVLEKIFSGLAAYTQKHFAYEEQLFDKHGYAGTQEHKQQHKALIDQVVDLSEKFKSSGGSVISIEVMQFLKDWLTNHIMKTDKEYTDFLVEKGVK